MPIQRTMTPWLLWSASRPLTATCRRSPARSTWGNRLSRPVHSFLASQDLSGKIVAPFITYEVSSGGGQAPDQLQQLCPASDLRDLLTILGENAESAGTEIDQWFDEQVGG